MTDRTENDAIIETVTKLSEPVVHPLDPTQPAILAVASGVRLESLKKFEDERRLEPERRKGTATFQDLASFIAHANRFKDADSSLFADSNPKSAKLVSVLNYHRAGAAAPRFGDHRGIYAFPLSEEWEAWSAKDGVEMSQADFAAFLEERVLDVADPSTAGDTAKLFAASTGYALASASTLIGLSRGLKIRVDERVQNAQNLATGEVALQFSSTHTDENGAALRVPGAFLIAIPVFKFGAAYQLGVRLRYRTRNGSITWFLELYRADRAFDHAFREACTLAQQGTELPLFLGSPES